MFQRTSITKANFTMAIRKHRLNKGILIIKVLLYMKDPEMPQNYRTMHA